MNQDVRTMLDNMYTILNRKHTDPVTAWDYLIDLLAIDNRGSLLSQMGHRFGWFTEDSSFAEELMKTYDRKLLRSDYYDHLGEMYYEKIASKQEANGEKASLVPMNVVAGLAELTIPKTDDSSRVLDPAVGTGRLLMATHKAAPKAILFGLAQDLRKLRIALTNCAIHNIEAYLLHADSQKHETDIATEDGRHNWQYANQWNSCTDRLRPKRNTVEKEVNARQ